MRISIADEEYTHFRNTVKLKTSACGELDSIPKNVREEVTAIEIGKMHNNEQRILGVF